METLTPPTELTARLDHYKLTMSQLAYEIEPDTEVTFALKNRGPQRLADHIDTNRLQETFDEIRDRNWSPDEINYLSQLGDTPLFTPDYLEYLDSSRLPEVEVGVHGDDLAVTAVGPWPLVTFWETAVMSAINDQYFENLVKAQSINLNELYREGDHRLSDKITALRRRPDIRIADFGTRRHFSPVWQHHVVERLAEEIPNNLIGTSNVFLARELALPPIGTYAHEMPMVWAGLADARGGDIRASHGNFLDTWYGRYGRPLSLALTDTFTTDFFFGDFSTEQATAWRGVRHDSGDPYKFGESLIDFYDQLGIDSREKVVVFSDSLDLSLIIGLQDRFRHRLGTVFGWGTNLTNDVSVKPLNIVMKAIDVCPPRGPRVTTVKLSDIRDKYTGTATNIERYNRIFHPSKIPGRNRGFYES